MSFGIDNARNLLYSLPQYSPTHLTKAQHHHLIQHSELVLETADTLLTGLTTPVGAVSANHLFSNFDDTLSVVVRCGALLHDVGKALHPNELSGPGDGTGNQHEVAGYNFCLSQGVPLNIARCCITHGQWHRWFDTSGLYIGCDDYDWSLVSSDRSDGSEYTVAGYLPDLLVALADNIWKGARHELLESLVSESLFSRGNASDIYAAGYTPSHSLTPSSGKPLAYWQFAMELDGLFESIASDGDHKLQRSQTTDAVDHALLRQLSAR